MVLGHLEKNNYEIKFFDIIDSTNEEAKRYLNSACKEKIADRQTHGQAIWITAAVQSKGKGRRNKKWNSPLGNLYASAIIDSCDNKTQKMTHFAFVAGLALRDAVMQMITEKQKKLARYLPLLKWPNDLVIDDKKCAGILLEVHDSHIIAGFGVNIEKIADDNMQADIGRADIGRADIGRADIGRADIGRYVFPPTGLKNYFDTITVLSLLQKLIDCFALRLGQLRQAGFTPLRSDWLKAAFRIGETVQIKQQDGVHRGIFTTIDQDGAIVVQQNGLTKKFFSGDFFIEISRHNQ